MRWVASSGSLLVLVILLFIGTQSLLGLRVDSHKLNRMSDFSIVDQIEYLVVLSLMCGLALIIQYIYIILFRCSHMYMYVYIF